MSGAPWLLSVFLVQARSETPRLPADQWLTNQSAFPAFVDPRRLNRPGFTQLQAEVVAGRLGIYWRPDQADTNAAVTLFVSADEPGHWPARDWRTHAMRFRGGQWETNAPIEDLDIPLVYFLQSVEHGATNYSPLRVCRPRAAGLEEPTRVFWAFLEGFEEDYRSWQLLAEQPPAASLSIDASSRSGRAALRVVFPEGRREVTLATPRVRGWQMQRNLATGLRLWLRTREGAGRARFMLLANALTSRQIISVSSTEGRLTNAWQRVDLPLHSFPNLPLADVDLFAIEFTAPAGTEFLLDDLQVLGRWKLVPE